MRQPLYTESDYLWNSAVVRKTERLMMPLSNDNLNVDMVFAAQVFSYHNNDNLYPRDVHEFSHFRDSHREIMSGV